MKHVPIRLGPLALLLAVISIALTTLSILTFTTGRADMRLAERYADTVQERYALEAEGQKFVADVCEGRDSRFGQPEIEETIPGEEGASLHILLKRSEQGSYSIASWRFVREWEENTQMDNIWTGE